MVLVDRFNRPVIGARISVNSSYRCNYSCIFCHKEGIHEEPRYMTPEEIERVVRVLRRFGVRYIKITGGEPMLRKDIVEIVARIKSTGVEEISMTTTGFRLEKLAWDLREAGLDRVNISFHSLRRDRYLFITKMDRRDATFKAVEAALDAGLLPIKLNMVILKGVNEDEVWDMIDYSYSLGGGETNIVQFIELLNVDPVFFKQYFYPLDKVEEMIAPRVVEKYRRSLHNRMVYVLDNGVKVEFVKPMWNNAFCMGNDRIRITYDGKFKPCLMRSDNHVDFITYIREGYSDEYIVRQFLEAVRNREPFFKTDRVEGFEIGEHIDRSVCPI